MTIHLGADHRGFTRKEQIKALLVHEAATVIDHGAASLVPEDDYPDYAHAVAAAVAAEPESRGIIVCGSGAGVCMAANRHDGVRAVLGFDTEQVRAAAADDHANILCLSADYGEDDDALILVETFLGTSWDTDPRHERRVAKIEIREAKRNEE